MAIASRHLAPTVIPEGKYRVARVLTETGLAPPPEGVEATLETEDDRVAGLAGCNRYMGQINEDGTFGPLATTMMACLPEIMEFEQAFLGLLSRVDEHRPDRSKLVLLEGSTSLVELDADKRGEPKTPK